MNKKSSDNKINRSIENINNMSDDKQKETWKEEELKLFEQLTEQDKAEIKKYTDSVAEYMNNIILPTQNFTYPQVFEQNKKTYKQIIKLEDFNYCTITLNKDNQLIKTIQKGQYFVEHLENGIFLEMIYIPGGSFLMGICNEEHGVYEEPIHKVDISPFLLGKFSITQEQWKIIMEHNLSANQTENNACNLPVENTCWLDAIEFCQRISAKTGHNYRLPSEAEWEYACRANTQTPYSFGKEINTNLANYWDISEDDMCLETKPVGSYYPNAFGIYDMHGNVYELCQDAWHINYEGSPTDGSAWGNGHSANMVVIRGGSFDYYERNCLCGSRSETPIDYRYHGTGFRVACSI